MIRGPAFSLAALLLALSVRAEVIDIDNGELARLSAAGVPIIDIRTVAEWQQSGVVQGSRLITKSCAPIKAERCLADCTSTSVPCKAG